MKKINTRELLKGLCILILYMIVLPDIIVIAFQRLNLDLNNDTYYMIANILIYVISFIVLFLVYRKSLIEDFKKFKNNLKSNVKIGFRYWLKAFGFMLVSNLTILIFAQGIATNEAANRTMISAMPFFSILSMCVLGPFLEEMIFRRGFKDAFNNPKIFLIISSLLFGAAHLLSAFTLGTIEENLLQLLYIIPYAGIGYFFAKAYQETDTIFTSTMIHMFHNTVSVIVVLIAAMGV